MASFSVTGLGSNLDVDSIVTKLMTVERRPLDLLAQAAHATQTRISAFGQLKSLIATFQSTMSGLTAAKFSGMKASVGDTTLATASVASGAAEGAHTLEVLTLAQSQRLASAPLSSASVGSGTLTFAYGTTTGSSFAADAARTAETVTIAAGQSTPAGIRDAVNAANIGVTASLITDSTGDRLVFASRTAGAASSLKLTVDDDDGLDTDAAGLSQLAYDPAQAAGTGRNLSLALAAQDATFKLDGLTIAKPSNTVSGVLEGVTLTLSRAAPGTSTSLTLQRDDASATSAVQTFVEAWNDVQRTLATLAGYDSAQKKAGTLQGDSLALAFRARLSSIVAGTTSGPAGALTRLSQAGVTLQKDGTLALDATRLATALSAQGGAAVARLFSATATATDARVSVLGTGTMTQAAAHAIAVTTAPTRGQLAAGSAPSLTVTAGVNDTLSLRVDGVQTTVTLAAGAYASAAELAAQVQARINAATELAAVGAAVDVTVDGGQLVVTSRRYGSASNVGNATGAAAASIFGATPAETAGTDIVGTIDGLAATGSGLVLAGAAGTAAEGLRVQVAAGALGALGTVQVGSGYADLLARAADSYLGSGAGVAARVEGLNKQLDAVGKRQDALAARLAETERRMRAQFAALDVLMSRMNSTSSYLQQQLANLPGAYDN